ALLNDTPGFVDPRALEALSMEGEPPSVRYMLRTASYLKRLQFVLPSLAYWLVWEAIREGGTTDRRFWNEVAMELTPVTAPEAAWLDLTLLATGNDPRSLYSSPQSGEALAAAWQQLLAQLREYGQAADERLTSALIDALGRRPWRTDQAQTAAVMDLTRRLTADGARPRLKTTVLDVSEALRQLPRRAPVAQLAQTCARAYAEGLEARLAVEALAESGVITSGAQATRVLEQLHRVLADSAVTSEKTPPLAWLGTFAVKFADGTFGEQTAAEFTACTMRSVREQLRHNVNLLWIAATRGGSTPPALNDADADHLERIGGAIEEMVREARKRPGGLITRSLHSITGRRDTKDNGE
ncbi:MAG TPA: hypothetical protein VF070_40845, partial [Streptosporangiaceae bacterium]